MIAVDPAMIAVDPATAQDVQAVLGEGSNVKSFSGTGQTIGGDGADGAEFPGPSQKMDLDDAGGMESFMVPTEVLDEVEKRYPGLRQMLQDGNERAFNVLACRLQQLQADQLEAERARARPVEAQHVAGPALAEQAPQQKAQDADAPAPAAQAPQQKAQHAAGPAPAAQAPAAQAPAEQAAEPVPQQTPPPGLAEPGDELGGRERQTQNGDESSEAAPQSRLTPPSRRSVQPPPPHYDTVAQVQGGCSPRLPYECGPKSWAHKPHEVYHWQEGEEMAVGVGLRILRQQLLDTMGSRHGSLCCGQGRRLGGDLQQQPGHLGEAHVP